MKQRLILIIKGALLPLALLGAWQWASGQGAAAAYIFVSLGDLAHSLRDLILTGELWVHLRASLGRALAGLLLGGSAGIVTGALMAQSPLADRLIGPLFHSIRQVPLLGLIPLLGLWVGNGDGAKQGQYQYQGQCRGTQHYSSPPSKVLVPLSASAMGNLGARPK